MTKKLIFFTYLFLQIAFTNVSAGVLSASAKVSLLTLQPGTELYSIFGHSAIRICDTTQNIDLAFNYGTFNFSEPNFYLKFIGGQLKYMLAVEEYKYFYSSAQIEGRGLVEQQLNFTPQQADTLLKLLEINYRDENRYYRYDFFYDNCSSRIRDIIEKAVNNNNLFEKYQAPQLTFRQHYTLYVKGQQPWSVFGIDLLLGSTTDITAPSRHAMFLPDNLKLAFDTAYITPNIKLVKHTNQLIPNAIFENYKSWFTPLNCMIIFMILGFVIMAMPKVNKVFDVVFYSILGLLGLLLSFISTLSLHGELHSNYNILWALPTHLLVPFIKNKRFRLIYFSITALINLSLLLFWFGLPQSLHLALIPVLILIIAKSVIVVKQSRT